MKMARNRILLFTTTPDFLADFRDNSEFEIQLAESEEAVHFLLREWEPAVIILQGAFFKLLLQVRKNYPLSRLGIIMVSNAPLSDAFEEKAFRYGADHVLSGTTASVAAIAVRARSLINRSIEMSKAIDMRSVGHPSEAEIKLGEYAIFPHDFVIKRGQDIVNTTPTQFRLLMVFLSHPDQLLARSWLREVIWENEKISPRSIDAQISKLKRLMPELNTALANVYGKGYLFNSSKAPPIKILAEDKLQPLRQKAG